MLGGPGMNTLSEDVMSKNHIESEKCDGKANVMPRRQVRETTLI